MNKKSIREYYNSFRQMKWIFKNLLAYFRLTRDYKKPLSNLNLYEQKFFSQNGEDGIIKAIFTKIGITNKFCVEFGIHPNEGNTIYLKKKGWNCLWMDGNGDGEVIKKEYITKDNVEQLFEKYAVPKELDLLSIDIDSNDYWIWKAIKRFSPRVVIMEYNSNIPLPQSKTIKYDLNASWDGTDYFGASLSALNKLGKLKGYVLVACDRRGVNSFFIRKDLVKNKFELRDIKKIFFPPGYGKVINWKRSGYPKSKKKMVTV